MLWVLIRWVSVMVSRIEVMYLNLLIICILGVRNVLIVCCVWLMVWFDMFF